MKSIVDSLSAAGQLISDDDLILYILVGLSQDHDPVVVTLTSRTDRSSLQEVQFLLQIQEMCSEQLNVSATFDLANPFANPAAHLHRTLNLCGSPTTQVFSNTNSYGRPPNSFRRRSRG
ncbi:hypothetical protein PanWU01x14_315630 [Parasponia andersonii]|uniref:Uncharacterized protein n=1 Tax=Parasponia andersonii TaxID=3476 RepID=A0A2P5ANN4_PARAD|nr:hypothetical protein PanWU01x14_315630 [Parasponia andersonii]